MGVPGYWDGRFDAHEPVEIYPVPFQSRVSVGFRCGRGQPELRVYGLERSGYLDIQRPLRRADAPAKHAFIASDLRKKLMLYPGTSTRAMVAGS